jgi:hypothetical protein
MDIHVLSRIQTHNLSNKVATDPRLRLHSHQPLEHMVKVKFTLEEDMKAQRGSRSIALLFL